MSLKLLTSPIRAFVLVPIALAALAQIDCSASNGTGGASAGGAGGLDPTNSTDVEVNVVGVGRVEVTGKAGTKTCERLLSGVVQGECSSQWATGDAPTLTAKETDPASKFLLWAQTGKGDTLGTMPTLPVPEGGTFSVSAAFSGAPSMTTSASASSGTCGGMMPCCVNAVCPTTVIDQLKSIAGLAQQGTDLFYLGSVHKLAKAGGVPLELVSIDTGSFAVDATDLYWVDGSATTLWTEKLDGSGPKTIASLDGMQYSHQIVMDDTDIYMTWVKPGAGSCTAVMRVPKAGGVLAEVAESCIPGSPYAIALNATDVFWGTFEMPSGGSLYTAPKSASAMPVVPLLTSKNAPVTRIVVDGSTVFMLRDGVVMLDVANPKGATHVASTMTLVSSFDVDASAVYIVGNLGLAKTDRATAKETLLAYDTGVTLTVDATDVYWGGGAAGMTKIFKIAK